MLCISQRQLWPVTTEAGSSPGSRRFCIPRETRNWGGAKPPFPPRRIAWPGEPDTDPIEDIVIPNREEDFVEYMHADVEARRRAEDQFIAGLVLSTGEVP